MSKLTFFHNRRKDGAVRNGLAVNEEIILHSFTPAVGDPDPVLLWFIDLRFDTERAKLNDTEVAREFLIGIGSVAQQALRKSAEELRAGLDMDIWPAERPIAGLPPDVKGKIVFSATERLTRGELANAFRDLAENWSRIVGAMEPALEVA